MNDNNNNSVWIAITILSISVIILSITITLDNNPKENNQPTWLMQYSGTLTECKIDYGLLGLGAHTTLVFADGTQIISDNLYDIEVGHTYTVFYKPSLFDRVTIVNVGGSP